MAELVDAPSKEGRCRRFETFNRLDRLHNAGSNPAGGAKTNNKSTDMATLKKLMTLLSLEGLTSQRAEIISHFTGGRTSSAKELQPAELDELCAVLDKNTLKLDQKRKRCIRAVVLYLKDTVK